MAEVYPEEYDLLVKAITVASTTLHPVDNNTPCTTIHTHTNMYAKQSSFD